ncbi:MAG TPA: hypothetical protein PLD18_08000 [Flavobacterium sp.]|nr:hypothetical protein [Flavobacterium sp.]HRA72545.1 hypothetical protein [Flavobacterium sp.]
MNLKKLVNKAKDKSNFVDLKAYVTFCDEYLNYISDNLQATIVSQNENHYRFYQYKKEGNFQITRPINSNLMYDANNFTTASKEFLKVLRNIKTIDKKDGAVRDILNNATYTIQQSVGSALDGLPAGQSNTARKLNGDLFEHFIRLIIREIGIDCNSGTIKIPVIVDDQPTFNMSYQHDLIIEKESDIKVIGSIKTSSKDRIDKIFIDKFLYNKLTDKETPHIAIFLNDVQRKKGKRENEYGINATFLPGHFKGYTVKLNPLDGVYYCDIRPNMRTENILKDHIKTFDNLLIEDIWKFI